jgi:hypothetical protein
MTYLVLATGLRPSSLRPLRRCGKEGDVLWETGFLLVRRSQSPVSACCGSVLRRVPIVLPAAPRTGARALGHYAVASAAARASSSRSPSRAAQTSRYPRSMAAPLTRSTWTTSRHCFVETEPPSRNHRSLRSTVSSGLLNQSFSPVARIRTSRRR